MKKVIKDVIFTTISLILIIVGYILQSTLDELTYKWLIMVIFGLAFLIGGYAKAKEGIIKTIENKSLNVEILMILAAIGAFVLSDYAEGAVLIFIFALSGILEEYTTLKSEKTLTELLTLAPEEAVLMTKNGQQTVLVKDLQIDDVVMVKVGEQIPIDGKITKGNTSIDESMITGEFVPVDRFVGDEVFAGTINKTSTIEVRVIKDAKDTVVQKIVDFVSEAQNSKTPTETLIQKIEKWYVYIVILLAAFLMVVPALAGWWSWDVSIERGIIVLVVGSPCALVASITPAILSSMSNAARKGILVKGGPSLEKLKDIDTVLFDKTGTITEGTPRVVGFSTYNIDEEEFKRAVVSIESHSSHPLAYSIVNHFKNVQQVEVDTHEKPGFGLEAKIGQDNWMVGRFDMSKCEKCQMDITSSRESGNTIVNVAKNGKMVGIIELRDTIRKGTKETIDALNKENILTVMVTGDNKYTAESIAKELGIKKVISECFPDQKVDVVKDLQTEGHNVLMIGDGINDAPALAISDVSVAMGSGAAVSLETADMVFMNNNLFNLKKMINLSKKMRIITMENVIFSISVIVFLLTLNIFGLVEIPIGVLAHEGSTILVILNSLRLLIYKK